MVLFISYREMRVNATPTNSATLTKLKKLMQKVNSSLRQMIILVLKLQLTDLNKPIYIDHYDT